MPESLQLPSWPVLTTRSRATRLVLAMAMLVGALVVGVALAAYPVTVVLLVMVVGIAVLSWRAPALALGCAALLFGFEGTIKIQLGLESSPLPGTARSSGALVIDVALTAAVAGVLLADRLRTPRALWSAANRSERVVLGLLGAWLALSVVEIPQHELSRGLEGFRLFQWYSVVAPAALVVFATRDRLRATRIALLVGLVVAGYAALRVVTGPTEAERQFALSVDTVTEYGKAFRAVGSFSSAVGLSSFVAPLAVFALAVGLFLPRLRVAGWMVGLLALVAMIASYSRASLFGVALGLVGAVLAVLGASGMTGRRRLVVVLALVGVLGGTYGGLWVASRASPQLRERASGVLDPLHDESVKIRFHTWKVNFDSALRHPLGQGLGTVGGASAPTHAKLHTTDNSFLKVLVEQGVLGLVLFAGGALGAVVLLTRRLRPLSRGARSLGIAALAGFTSFLGIAFAGETVEQPGKIVAWGLLGIAAACAFFGERQEPDPDAEAPA